MLARLIPMNVVLATRNVLRQRRRTALGLATICGGVVAMLLAGGFVEWIFQTLRDSTIQSQLGHVQITRPGYFREGITSPYDFLLPADIPASIGEGRPKPMAVTPRLAFSGLLSKGDATVSFIGEGVDPAGEAPISKAVTILSGYDLHGTADRRSALLGEGLAASIGAIPGDSVILLANTANGGINAVELHVAGIFATIAKDYDDTALRVPIEVARELVRVDGATVWVGFLDRTEDTDDEVARLRQALPADQFEITPWSALADFYNKTVSLFSRQLTVIRILIAMIVMLTISNTLSMAVNERTAEIGTTMALGVKRHGILRLFLWEGAILGLLGGLIGVVLALVLGAIISTVGIPMPPPPGMVRGYIGEIVISPSLVVEGLLLALATAVAASVLPAIRASRMNIVDALRHLR